MSRMTQEDAERIAAEYFKGIGCAPADLDGSVFDGTEDPPIWLVFFTFRERSDELIGLPDGLIVHVNDLTGEPSHLMNL